MFISSKFDIAHKLFDKKFWCSIILLMQTLPPLEKTDEQPKKPWMILFWIAGYGIDDFKS